jgi:uncharacterized protein with HEPN domain
LPPEDRTRIEHMIEAAETACNSVSGRARDDLETDQMLAFALVRAIEIVGEAANNVSAATRQASADVPWRLIISMRNRVVHAYFDIDREIVWKTATQELPELLPKLRALIAE